MAAQKPASGYATWRFIAEELRTEIIAGGLSLGARVPSESELAERFGVNRHTVRQAIASLGSDGLLTARRGSGTYVTGTPPYVHRVGLRTRFSSAAGGQRSGGRMIDHAIERPNAEIRHQLDLGDRDAIRLETMNTIRKLPVTRSSHWFDAERFPHIAELLEKEGSVTASLRALGVEDYIRQSTTVSARQATAAEADDLALELGAVVLVTHALDVLADGSPLHYVVTRFAAQRVVLDIEHGLAAE